MPCSGCSALHGVNPNLKKKKKEKKKTMIEEHFPLNGPVAYNLDHC